jgi:hypothetical protein
MSATAGDAWTPTQLGTTDPAAEVPRDGLATASLVLGILGFLPLPGTAASVLAVILGSLSGRRDADGKRRRSGAAVTGMVLGCVSIGLLLLICVIYFGVLGYPLPQVHRYQPPGPTDCSCPAFVDTSFAH